MPYKSLILEEFPPRLQTTQPVVSSEHKLSVSPALFERGRFGYEAAYIKHRFNSMLTKRELTEIMKYKYVWYWGQYTHRKNKFSAAKVSKGHYKGLVRDHLAYRYEILGHINSGSFGSCYRALDHKTGTVVAVKVLANKGLASHKLPIEVRLLHRIHTRGSEKDRARVHRSRQRIISCFDHFIFRGHSCITFELMGPNLLELMRMQSTSLGLGIGRTRRITRQICEGLRVLKERNVIHCDLKPENITTCRTRGPGIDIKLIDFGSACVSGEQVFDYVQSRYYRSPEVIIGAKYDHPIDIWSLGCLVAELITGKPLLAGRDEKHQLRLQLTLLGRPPAKIINTALPAWAAYLQDKEFSELTEVEIRRRISATTGIREVNAIAFIADCLKWDPALRLTPTSALRHAFVIH